MTTPKDPPCKTPGCTKHAQWKGLCRSCYGQAKDLIDKGLTSWDELGTLGMIELEAKPFKNEFFKRKEAQESKAAEQSQLLRVEITET